MAGTTVKYTKFGPVSQYAGDQHAGKPLRAKFDLAQTTTENRRHWENADQLSARAALSPAVRRVVRMRSRYESENNSWYAGILRTAVNHIVGIGPKLQILTGNTDADQRIEVAFRKWASMIDFADVLRTAVETYWREGEVFFMRHQFDRHWPYTLDLKIIDPDQVANPYFQEAYNDPFINDGIAIDAAANELALYVYDHHPYGEVPLTTLSGSWYPAQEVLHLFRAERPGQIRGIPRATPALQTLPIMRRQELATLYSAESAANFSMYLKTNHPNADPAQSPVDFAEIELTRNMLTTLPEGWEIGQVEPKQPGPLYEMFQRQALMSFARCTNMPYTLAAGTGKDANFSSFKGDMKNVWEPEVKCEQSRIEHSVLNHILRWWMDQAAMIPGLLSGVPPIEQIDHRWHWPPLPTLDPKEDALARTERITTGQSSFSAEYATKGQEWETEVERMAADFNVTVPEMKQALFRKLWGNSPTQTPVQNSSETASPEPTSDDSEEMVPQEGDA